jgi:hypothetical protein
VSLQRGLSRFRELTWLGGGRTRDLSVGYFALDGIGLKYDIKYKQLPHAGEAGPAGAL